MLALRVYIWAAAAWSVWVCPVSPEPFDISQKERDVVCSASGASRTIGEMEETLCLFLCDSCDRCIQLTTLA